MFLRGSHDGTEEPDAPQFHVVTKGYEGKDECCGYFEPNTVLTTGFDFTRCQLDDVLDIYMDLFTEPLIMKCFLSL